MRTLRNDEFSANPPAFALISVLALVSLAALSATAFLAAARLEKTASLTTGDQTRMTLALDSGFHLGSYPIIRGDQTWNWADFLVGETNSTNDPNDTIGYLFHAVPSTNLQGVWSNYAMFSCATLSNVGSGVSFSNLTFATTNQGGFAAVRSNTSFPLMRMITFSNINSSTRIPLLFGRTSLPVAWITNYATDPSGTNPNLIPTFRFAYFTEDISGLVDAERMGGITNRSTGTNPAEISVSQIGIASNKLTNFTSLRRLFLTQGMIKQAIENNALGNGAVTNPWRYLYGSFYSVNGWNSVNATKLQGYQRIPAGLGYLMAENTRSQPKKYNLNDLIAGGAASSLLASNIAGIISSNLPNFASTRAGGFLIAGNGGATNTNAFTTNAYLQTLAASIIDYADTDSTPTTDGTPLTTNRTRPVFRGVDSYPFVNEINKRYQLLSTNPATEGGTSGIMYVVVTTDFIELWNPSSQTIPSGTLTFLAAHRQPASLGFLSTSFANPTRASNNLGPVTNGVTTNTFSGVTLPPNGFLTLACPTVTNYFFSPTTNPVGFQFLLETTNSQYGVAWNGVFYDAALGGLYRNSGTLASTATILNRANIPGFIYRTSAGFANPAVGDPRAVIYLSRILDANQYVGNSTFGGRNVRAGTVFATNQPYYEVAPRSWPDGGHNSTRGTAAANDSMLPTAVTPVPNTNIPPGRISNFGSFTNVCELGAVFDPMQWSDPGLGAWEGKYTNLTIAGTPTNAYGGGNTLRIGRAEHGKFAWTNVSGNAQPNMQASAAALLDIFCATPTNPTHLSGRFDDGNQININTAPPGVLRALAAGVVLSNDPAMLPSTNFSIPTIAISNFVKGVTNFRARYPFYSPSQLTFIGTNANWPNTNDWPAGAVFSRDGVTNVTEWNDTAAEEWFSKIYALSKVQSRNFRIYVQAQLIKKQGTNYVPSSVIGRRYYDYYNQQNNENPPSCSLYLLRKVDY